MVRPRDVVEQWARAFNARDADAAAGLYDENASNWQLAIGGPVVGREDIRMGLRVFFQAFPDSAIRTEALIEAGNTAHGPGSRAVRGRACSPGWRRMARPTPFTAAPSSNHGCSLFEVVHERIMSQRAYWDRATWFRQLDIPL
jgi:ketosteroid isomerase-like protein